MIPADALERLERLLEETRDVVAERVTGPDVPAWCQRRGWAPFLLGLDDATLARSESEGLADVLGDLSGAPDDLVALAARVREATSWVPVAAPSASVERGPHKGVSARKLGQVSALAELCGARPRRYGRIVDVGAGRGYLTRELARVLSVSALGLERSAERVESARALTQPEEATEFVVCEAGPEGLTFRAGDLAVGLHACGALGDSLVRSAARDRVDLLLVNCCLQHVPGDERRPLSEWGRRVGLTLSRDVLGLTNQGTGRRVTGTTPGIMATRTTRHALRLLLRARGVETAHGEEMRGLNLRQARKGLAHVSALALAARDLPLADGAELTEAEQRAQREFARVRRLSLPRGMLGRPLELAVVLDRACALEEAGHDASVRTVFHRAISPRNLGVVAWAQAPMPRG